jgi:hypothetical protein
MYRLLRQIGRPYLRETELKRPALSHEERHGHCGTLMVRRSE